MMKFYSATPQPNGWSFTNFVILMLLVLQVHAETLRECRDPVVRKEW